jgi:drug/metabolite transporter (DMT)-like permease
MKKSPLFYSLIAIAIIAVSFGAILIRLAGDVPVLSIAAWRLGVSFLFLIPFSWRGNPLKAMSRRDFLLSVASGTFLALHFILWISSLRYTSVASSVVLVSTNPIFVALGARFILKEPFSRARILATFLSVCGASLIGWGDFHVSGVALYGDLFAIGGAVMASAYFLIGRRVREKVPLPTYILTSYGTAAILLLSIALITHQRLIGFPRMTYLYLVLLAVGPQLIGHSIFNWALRYLSASTVAILILGEPVAATLLAYLILGEGVTLLKGIGAAVILSGIYLSLHEEAADDEHG